MICILLCAGYATRMYPLTENFPKPLLKVKEKTIIDYLIDDLESSRSIEKYVVVSNHKFINHFEKWRSTRTEKIVLLDDGSTSNENRLGAVKDIQFAIDELAIKDDIIVLAGDNVLDFSLEGFVNFSKERSANAVMCYFEDDSVKLSRTGVAKISEDGLIMEMIEKPQIRESNWAIPPFYIFNKESLREIKMGIASGCKVDAPGSFLEWFIKRNQVYAYHMPGKRIDIGNLEQYYEVK
ncbi:MAG: nucleotidyltransferase family protein [Clostridia bacterium]|nr:nucleotidyltransferase family protein [Clostridia bacterium]